MSTRLPPGPRGHWLTGNLPEFRRDMLAFFIRCAREFGDVASFRLGPKRIVLLSHPDHVEQVLVTDNRNFIKHYLTRALRPLLGDGLLTSEGDLWLRQRRLIQPAFARTRIDSYGPIVVAHAERMLAGWHDGETRDLHVDMMHLALSIVARALLDVDLGTECGEVGQALDVLMADFSHRFESLWAPPRWLPTPGNLRLKRAVGQLNAVINGIIRQRRSAGGDRGDLLSVLMEAQDEGGGMSDQQLRGEVMTLFLAGHETTANALSWTGYLLARHPEVEAKLLAELDAVLGGRAPAVADLPRLTYTEGVFLESMRLYPPVYGFGREAIRDCVIGGYDVRAGTTIIMSQYVVQRDPRFYDEPEKFHPERWADGLMKRLPKFAYFPFGGGPRVCIGNTFALMEGVLVLATMMQRYRLTLLPGHPVKPWPSVTLRPAGGIKVVLGRR